MSNFRVPYLVGNTRLVDHQYWPVKDYQAFIDEFIGADQSNRRSFDGAFPVGVSLEVLMHLSWRVRKWKISAGSFEYSGISPSLQTYDWSGGWPEFFMTTKRVKIPPDEEDELRDVTDEQDILGPATDATIEAWPKGLRNRGIQGAAEDDSLELLINDLPSDATVSGSIETNLLGTYVLYEPIAKLFYPAFNFLGTALEDIASPRHEVRFYTLANNPIADPLPAPDTGTAGDVPQGLLTIHNPIIAGPDITVPLGMLGAALGNNIADGSGSVAIEMTAVEFWPYRNSQGAPVYSETTGEALVDPFS